MHSFFRRARVAALALAATVGLSSAATAQTNGQILIGSTADNAMKLGTITGTLPLGVSNGANSITLSIGGLSALGTGDQLLGMNAAGTAYEYKGLSGTTNRVTVTNGAGSITLSLPQDIHTGASPTFSGLTLGGLNSAGVVHTNGSGALSTSAIVNADVDAAAAIALSKLAALGNNFALVSNGSGVISASAVTATELGYLSGVTSAIQTQIDAKVPTTRTVSTTLPLSGGGALSSNLTLSIADAAADGTNKGAAAFTANDFNAASGVVSIDYTNGQAASASANGFLSSADWSTFNGKQSTTLNSGLVWIGSAGNVATATALSGDVTVANTGAVTIANSAVTTAKINDGAVTTAKIAAGAVTSTELGAAAVTTAKIAAGAVTSTELGTGAVTTAKIAAGAVTTTEIADGTIADGDVSASAGIAATKIGGGAVDNTEYSYLDGVTSAIQTQLNGKQSTTLTNGTVWIGNGSNVATAVTLSGDVTTTNAGVTSIGAAKVTNAMLAGSIAASKLVGTDIATVGTITAGTWNGTTIAVANGGTGAVTLTGYVKGTGTAALSASSTIPGADISGNISGNAANVTGTVAISNGGTGATTANGALNALLPDQSSNSGKVLQTNGTNAVWVATGAAVTMGGDLSGSADNAQIVAGAVGTTEIADNAVTSSKIADGTVGTSDIADGAVTSAKIGAGEVATSDIADGAVIDAKITAVAASKLTGQVSGANGGTGVDNTGKTITLGGNLTTSGAFATTLTVTGTTNVTLPTSGTLATTGGTWTTTGNSGTTSGTNFVGTTDAQELVFKTNNVEGFRMTVDATAPRLSFLGASTPAYRIDVPNNSNVGIGRIRATGYATWSSRKWKENIRPVDNALNKVLALEGVYFNWKPQYGGGADMGFVMEEVNKVLPEIVDKDANGEVMGMDYSRITSVLVQALKEEHAKTEAMAKDIAELKAMVATLAAAVKPATSTDTPVIGAGSTTVIDIKPATIGQNVPNPFEGVTSIPYFIPKGVNVAELVISDNGSNELRRVVLGDRGVQSKITLSMSEFTSGVYQYALIVDGKIVDTKSMTLVR